MQSLITVIAERQDVADFLAWPGDFDLDRGVHVEEVHLASGAELEGFAGDGAGGTYFFCGDGGEERPILYADSEGRAALVASGLRELLQLLLVAPWWRDCREFTPEESCELAAEYLEDMPGVAIRRDRAAAVLGIVSSPPPASICAKPWGDNGCRTTAIDHGDRFGIDLEIVQRDPAVKASRSSPAAGPPSGRWVG
ncbi:hypothetical protein [Streptacidiphilus melanogenes]|uniref:hypothetical protein n=1 Tax=Streptacidiphilus melanogenes TaxID=411235 RepID=UPI001F401C39|nr:hypothetical protein [Streptacidiphilus melanogenes]